MRAFFALEISEQFRGEVAALARRLDGPIVGRFTSPENYHVTLAFLGDLDEAGIRSAMAALDVACAGFEVAGSSLDAANAGSIAAGAKPDVASSAPTANDLVNSAASWKFVPSRPAPRPVPLECDGLGKFGKSRDATLWLGLKRADALVQLAADVREQLAARDVPFDAKPFKAHITIARRAALPKDELPALPFPMPSVAPAVTLFKSDLTPDGPRYTPLYSVDLQPE